jgi:hypothetical protein
MPVHAESVFSDYVMMKSFPPKLTPEQLALSEDRKLKRRQKQNAAASTNTSDVSRGHILGRQWMELPGNRLGDDVWKVKILSWNVCSVPFSEYVPSLISENQTALGSMSRS